MAELLSSVARNRYSVPCELAGQMFSTRLYSGRIAVVADDAVAASHQRLGAEGQSGPPSGRVSVEHVINVLGRLNAKPIPPTVETALQTLEPPRADTARYDSLRAGDIVLEVRHA